MKILIGSTYYLPYLSGMTKYQSNLIDYLIKKNAVSILTFKYKNDLLNQEKKGKLTINRIPYHLKISKGLINFFYPLISLKYVLSNDCVIINLPQFEGFWLALWGRILSKKVIIIYHCDLYFNSGFLNNIATFITNISAFCSCLFSNKIIAYSNEYVKDSLVLKYFKKKIIFSLPPVKIDSPEYKYERRLDKKQFGTPLLGFVGRIASEKGIEYLLEALRHLQKYYPKIQLLIAGPNKNSVIGEEKYFSEIQNQINQYKLPVVYLGQLNDSELASFYKIIDLLVLPSINKTEAFGMVQVEAMLSGTPVIASNLNGVNIPIKLSGSGLLFKPANVIDLTNKIKQVLEDKQKYIPNINQVKKIFDINKVFKFYQNILNENN